MCGRLTAPVDGTFVDLPSAVERFGVQVSLPVELFENSIPSRSATGSLAGRQRPVSENAGAMETVRVLVIEDNNDSETWDHWFERDVERRRDRGDADRRFFDTAMSAKPRGRATKSFSKLSMTN